jgi:hypothetical protein
MDLPRSGRCITSNYDAGNRRADTGVTEVLRRTMAYLHIHSLGTWFEHAA